MAARSSMQALRRIFVARTKSVSQHIASSCGDGFRQSPALEPCGLSLRDCIFASQSVLFARGYGIRSFSTGRDSEEPGVISWLDRPETLNEEVDLRHEVEEIEHEEKSPSGLGHGPTGLSDMPNEDVDPIHEDQEFEQKAKSSFGLDFRSENISRRRRLFLMQKAMKMKVETDGDERPRMPQGYEMKVIDVNRTVKVTKGGKVQSFAAVVVCGNGDGVVGYGKGKSSEVGPAIDKACQKALGNLHFFERYRGHTIFHEHDSTFEKTKVYLWPARSGTGMRASHTVGGILRLAGYKDVKSKVIGSRNPLNTVKAVFQTLSQIESPEEVAERRGRPVVESHLLG